MVSRDDKLAYLPETHFYVPWSLRAWCRTDMDAMEIFDPFSEPEFGCAEALRDTVLDLVVEHENRQMDGEG